MTEFVVKGTKRLRKGVTTGSCAAAAAKAATITLLSGANPDTVSITALTGEILILGMSDINEASGIVSASVIKDAGDDPDVTNGIRITASVSKAAEGIIIKGGEGVGRVTKKGLKIPVGNAAINPAPLKMIEAEALKVCGEYGYNGGLSITISVPGGEDIALKTMNRRLGIVGGISILGTTGIVEPMSETALIDTIKTEIEMGIAQGDKELLVTPGNYGFDFARDVLGFDMEKAVKCSNFIGETLDYAVYANARRLTLVGHAGKLVKLAGGIMNTHSRIGDCRMEILAAHCALNGADSSAVGEIMDAVTVTAAMEIMDKIHISQKVWQSIEEKIAFHIRERVKNKVAVRFIVFTQEKGILIDACTNNATKKRS